MQAKHPALARLEGFFGVEGAQRYIKAKNNLPYYDEPLRSRLPSWAYKRLHGWGRGFARWSATSEEYVAAAEAMTRLFRSEFKLRFPAEEVSRVEAEIRVREVVDAKMKKTRT